MNITPTFPQYRRLHVTDTPTVQHDATLSGTLNNHISTPPSVNSVITELKPPASLESYTVLTPKDVSENHSQEQASLTISQTKIGDFNNAKNTIEQSITKKQSRKFLRRVFYVRSTHERRELAHAHITLAVHYATGLYKTCGDTILPKDMKKCIYHFQQATKVSKNGDVSKGKAWYALAKLSLTVTDFDRMKNKNSKRKYNPLKTAKKYLKRSKKAGYSHANDFLMAINSEKNGSRQISPSESYFRMKYNMYLIRGMTASQDKNDRVQESITHAIDYLVNSEECSPDNKLRIRAYMYELKCMKFTMNREKLNKEKLDYDEINKFVTKNPIFPGLNSAFGKVLEHQGTENKEFCDLAASQGNPLPAIIAGLQKNLNALCACNIPNAQAIDSTGSDIQNDIIHIETERLFYDFVCSCADVSHGHGRQTNELMTTLLNNLSTEQSKELQNVLKHIDIDKMTEATSKYLNHITQYSRDTQYMAKYYAKEFEKRKGFKPYKDMIEGKDIKEFLGTIPECNEEYQFNVESQSKLASTTLRVLCHLNQYVVKNDTLDAPTTSISTDTLFENGTKGHNPRMDGATLFHLQNLNLFIPQTTFYGWSENEKCIDYRKMNHHALGFLSDNMNFNKKSCIDAKEEGEILTKVGMEELLLHSKTPMELKEKMLQSPLYRSFYVDSVRQSVYYDGVLSENGDGVLSENGDGVLSENGDGVLSDGENSERNKRAVSNLFKYCRNDEEVDMGLFIALANITCQTYFDAELYCGDVLYGMAGKSSEYQKYASPCLYTATMNPKDKFIKINKVREDLYTVDLCINTTNILTYRENLSDKADHDILDVAGVHISKNTEKEIFDASEMGTASRRSVISVIKQEDGTWQYRYDLMETKIDLEDCKYYDNDDATATENKCRYLDKLESFVDAVNGYGSSILSH